MRYPPHALQLRTDTETSRPALRRTAAEVARLKKRHEVNKRVFVTVMVRRHLLTETEAAQQYDDQFRRW